MVKLFEIYTNSVKKNIDYYGTWPVDSNIKLGDYGILEGNCFNRYGNLKDDFNITIIQEYGRGTVEYSFQEGDVNKVVTRAGIATSDIKPSIEIQFGSESGVYFLICGCKSKAIKNYQQLGEAIIGLFYKKEWNSDFVVVTDLVQADASTILVSNGEGAKIKLEANELPIIDNNFFRGNIGFTIVNENKIGLNVIAKKNLIPLIRLSSIEVSYIRAPKWGKVGKKKVSLRRRHYVSNPVKTNNVVASISSIAGNKASAAFISEEFIRKELNSGMHKRKTRNRNIILKDGSTIETTSYVKSQLQSAILTSQKSNIFRTSTMNVNKNSFDANNINGTNTRLITFKMIK